MTRSANWDSDNVESFTIAICVLAAIGLLAFTFLLIKNHCDQADRNDEVKTRARIEACRALPSETSQTLCLTLRS